MSAASNEFTVSDYLIYRLQEFGAEHAFGVCGDYIMPFFVRMEASEKLEFVGTCNELNAGYAADGYSRLKGLGVAVVTGGVGALSVINAVAGAYVEDVPMVVISGTVDSANYDSQPRLHHMVPGNYKAPSRMFSEVTVASLLLLDPSTAPDEIDDAFRRCLTQKRPIYIEMSMDVQAAHCREPQPLELPKVSSDEDNLKELVKLIVDRVQYGSRTVVVPGHEIQRFGLQEELKSLVTNANLPLTTVMWGKEGCFEQLPQCVGFYQGALTQPDIREFVEGADTIIGLGALDTDLNTGLGTAQITAEQVIAVARGKARVKDKLYNGIQMRDLIRALAEALPADVGSCDGAPVQSFAFSSSEPYVAQHDAPITMTRIYQRLAHFMRPGDVLASDTSSSVNLAHTQFADGVVPVASSYWGSMGHGFAASLGACFAIDDDQRVIAVEGDGSFLMTAQELSTMGRYDKPAIVLLLNNKGYTIERIIHDGPFNDVPHWKFNQLPDTFGGGTGLEVRTEGEFEEALAVAENYKGPGPLLIEVHLETMNVSSVFQPLVEMYR